MNINRREFIKTAAAATVPLLADTTVGRAAELLDADRENKKVEYKEPAPEVDRQRQQAACYVRALKYEPGKGLQSEQGSGTLLGSGSDLYIVTAYHVAKAFGKEGASVYIPGARACNARIVYSDNELDHALMKISFSGSAEDAEKSYKEMAERSYGLSDSSPTAEAHEEIPAGPFFIYNEGAISGQQGGAVDTRRVAINPKKVRQVPYSLENGAPRVQTLFFEGVTFNHGQSGSLVYDADRPVGIAFANVKVDGKSGVLLVPWGKVKDSIRQYEPLAKDIAKK